jgi:hypothetical protein
MSARQQQSPVTSFGDVQGAREINGGMITRNALRQYDQIHSAWGRRPNDVPRLTLGNSLNTSPHVFSNKRAGIYRQRGPKKCDQGNSIWTPPVKLKTFELRHLKPMGL